MQRAEALIRVATEAGLLAPDATDDILERYRDATGDVPNLSFLDWLFIFNVMTPDDVQALSESFERTSFQCGDCGTKFTGRDLDAEDDGLTCISCQSANLERLETPAASAGNGADGGRNGDGGATARDVGPTASYDAGFSGSDPGGDNGGTVRAKTDTTPRTMTDSEAGEPSFEEFQEGLRPGTRVGRCTIVEFVARGGMGMVYKGRHLDLDRLVAVKVLLTDYTSNRTLAERFRQEARAVAAIEHPNIVQVYDYGEAGGHLYIIMQWVEGESLAQRMQRLGRVPPEQILEIGAQVCHALQAAHDQGIIHRDIKPDNILIMPDGLVKLADFGLSKNQQSDTRLSASGTYVGTPAYLAPEQLGPNVTPKADLYALACSLYHALTGRLPFGGDDAATVLQKHLTAPFPAAKKLNPSVPDEVDQLLQQMAAKNPKHRPEDATALGEMMLDLLEEVTGEEPPPSLTRTPGTDSLGRRRRRPSRSPSDAVRPGTASAGKRTGRLTPTQRAGGATRDAGSPQVPPPPTQRMRATRPLRKNTDPIDPDTGDIEISGGANGGSDGPGTGPVAGATVPVNGPSEPRAPANFPFRQQRKDQRGGGGLRVDNLLDSGGSGGPRPARPRTRVRRGTDKVTRSELQGVLDGHQRNRRWLPAVVAVGVLAVIGVVVALGVAASGSDPWQAARELIDRGQTLHGKALDTGDVELLRGFRTRVQQFRERYPDVSSTEFDSLLRQIDVGFVILSRGPEYEAALERLLAWARDTRDAQQARFKLGTLRQYAGLKDEHRAKIEPLTTVLERVIRREQAAGEMSRLLASSLNIRDADEAIRWRTDLQRFAESNPEVINDAFREELVRLDALAASAATSRIQRAMSLADPADAEGLLGELQTWRDTHRDLVNGETADRFDEALDRLRRMEAADREATELLGRARAAANRDEIREIVTRMRELQDEFAGLRERFASALATLEEKLEDTTALPLETGRPHGPFTFEGGAHTYVFQLSTLTLTGIDIRSDRDNTNRITAVLYDEDDRIIQIGVDGADTDGTRHNYVIRTLRAGRYRLSLLLDDAEGDPVTGVIVTMHQFPTTDEFATPEGAVPLTTARPDGPVPLSESRWYRFTLREGGWVQIRADFHEKYDVDIELFRHEEGTRIPGSRIVRSLDATPGSEGIVRWLPAGEYYLRAYLAEFMDMLENFRTGGSTVTMTLSTPDVGTRTPPDPRRMDSSFTGGALSSGEWVLPTGEYRISREIRIESGAALLLRAGTRMRFAEGVGITCHGRLIVEGMAGREVEFAPQEPRQRWANVLVEGPDAAVRIEHARFTTGGGRRYRWDNGSRFDNPGEGSKGGALFFIRTTQISLVDNCEIRNCEVAVTDDGLGGFGGAICIEEGLVEVRDTSLLGNRSGSRGGGVCTDLQATLVMIGCRFQDNSSSDGGGACIGRFGNARFERCVFDRNRTDHWGGGAACFENASVTFSGCEFDRNEAVAYGGLLARDSTRIDLVDTTFTRNHAEIDAGAAAMAATVVFVDRCTFADNSVDEDGVGGLYLLQTVAVVTNTRFTGNRGTRVGALESRVPPGVANAESEEATLRASNTFADNSPNDLRVSMR